MNCFNILVSSVFGTNEALNMEPQNGHLLDDGLDTLRERGGEHLFTVVYMEASANFSKLLPLKLQTSGVGNVRNRKHS